MRYELAGVMKISGVATMHAPAGQVWAALNDPAVLAATIPGCERLEPTGPDSYRFTVTAGVASIRGTYSGDISLEQQHEPSSFVLTATGAGGPGTVTTSVQVRLAASADGYTELSYDADAVVGGMIAGVGQRMLSSVAKRMAAEFFTSVDGVLAGNGAAAGLPAPLGAPGTGPAQAALPGTAPAAAAPSPAAYLGPARPAGLPAGTPGFARGVLVGAAIALAGVAVGGLLGRRAR
jgi:carbon monoxide dehydrogenase subunit G